MTLQDTTGLCLMNISHANVKSLLFINIFDIKEIIALKEKKRFTLNIPYDTVIIEKNGKKTYLAPENRDMMLEIIKEINPEIIISSSGHIKHSKD